MDRWKEQRDREVSLVTDAGAVPEKMRHGQYGNEVEMEQYTNRKATAQIRVVDEKGNVIKNAAFQAELTDRDFLFGCGAFHLGQDKECITVTCPPLQLAES